MGLGHGADIVRNGLVLHLDAANVKSYSGTGTTWFDLSGNGNNATLINGPTYGSNNNGSIVLDGVNDYITLPSNDEWAFGAYATFENWLYFDRETFGTNHRIWCVTNNAAAIDIFLATSTGLVGVSSSPYVYTSSSFPKYTWTQLTVVFNANNISVYFNGVNQQLTGGAATNPVKTNNASMFLGQFKGGGNYYFKGSTPLYTIYNRALTAAEIQQNFEATRGRYGI
jgi:hypothetical protein